MLLVGVSPLTCSPHFDSESEHVRFERWRCRGREPTTLLKRSYLITSTAVVQWARPLLPHRTLPDPELIGAACG